jgi:hypothetical protein
MDILERVTIESRCGACHTTTSASARTARDSAAMLDAQRCPVSDDRECPQLHYAAMMDDALLDELEGVWRRIEDAARRLGVSVALR